jgi:hypothetical protein
MFEYKIEACEVKAAANQPAQKLHKTNSWSRVCRDRIEDGIFETTSRREMEQMCHHKARIYHSDGYCCHDASATMKSGVAMSPLSRCGP